jgi:hypothetical protein
VWFRFEDCLNIDRPRYIHDSKFVFGNGVFIILFCSLRGSISENTGTLKWKFAVSFYFKLFSTYFSSTQICCTIRLADHGTKPGTAIQCKTKDSSCHRQSYVRVLNVIRAAQSHFNNMKLTKVINNVFYLH